MIKRGLLLEGRAISIGRNLSFHPIIDLLKQWAKIVEDDSQAKAFHKLEMVIRDIHPEETDEILPFVAILMGLKLTSRYKDRVKQIEGDKLEKLIIKSMRELLIKGSEKRPIVIVIEDLHWADKSSIELLEMLYTLARNHMLVFINVFRPGYIEAETNKIATLDKKYPDHCVQINIQPLMNDDTRRLIINMLMIKGLPYRIQEQIIDRVGNCFAIKV